MRISRKIFVVCITVLAALSIAGSALAGTVTSGNLSLTFPDYPLSGPGAASCEPWADPELDHVTLSGIPEGSKVVVSFVYASPYTGSPVYQPPVTYENVGGTLVIPVVYPMDTTMWPVFNPETNERAISVAAFIRVFTGPTQTKLISKQWWIRCVPPQKPFEGCTPGYWRQEQHFDSWMPTGYAPGDDYNPVFGVTAGFSPHTLLDAVWLGGGGEYALARHAVAALLNAAHPDINYYYTVGQVIAGVQAAYASGDFETFKEDLDFANNAGCPLD